MDLERVAGRGYEFSPQGFVGVGYGGAESVERSALVGTDALYTCVGVVLLDEDVVSLAHFPVEERFKVFVEGNGKSGYQTRTFNELADLLFEQHGLVSESTRAVIVGGVEGQSEVLTSRVEEELMRRGVVQITHRGQHSERVEWDLRVRQGEVTVSARKRPHALISEGSF